jgi:hypothetical protein
MRASGGTQNFRASTDTPTFEIIDARNSLVNGSGLLSLPSSHASLLPFASTNFLILIFLIAIPRVIATHGGLTINEAFGIQTALNKGVFLYHI